MKYEGISIHYTLHNMNQVNWLHVWTKELNKWQSSFQEESKNQ